MQKLGGNTDLSVLPLFLSLATALICLRFFHILKEHQYTEYRAGCIYLPNPQKGMMPLIFNIIAGALIPLFGTSIGSACVFLMKRRINSTLIKSLNGLAAGVMTAASVWSLLLPAIDRSSHLGKLAFLPSAIGLWLGIVFMVFINFSAEKLQKSQRISNCNTSCSTSMLVFSVTLHNIPEGMAVGAAFAAYLASGSETSFAEALILSLGISVQNFPEGAIISMPLKANGAKKPEAFAAGVLSGVVEPIAATLTVIAANSIVPLLPYFLSFAAGAMIYAVISELIPEANSNSGIIFYALGFTLMMALDVSLG